ncbi:hypothetical protein CEUSTIGMA_g3682.t1 [Chlamydomonas eustigma]|uniref:histidine kinase n=1 Tax=Chlamydomonas eustigma TaxID=1157962 RepID=A0A250WZH3_9CHLO|nr:hypothetical protein CEUSTIGMA_g3682.t1 [Chlamydomonas eustigma]|eukprot:GAX76238.1 hypothetical protein CEUSTIGMA_g3682.t1 [Chlamydomonas eustigma]
MGVLEPVYERVNSQETLEHGDVTDGDNKSKNSNKLGIASTSSIEPPTHGDGISGWSMTLLWAGCILLWYTAVQMFFVPAILKEDPKARDQLFSQLSIRYYQYSEAAFFTAAVLNLISLVFEETPEKRQLAFLSAIIKGLSWHSDFLVVTGQAIIVYDGYGAILLPGRYVQWSCTTPTMLFTLSKISDFTSRQTWTTMFFDWLMIITGFIAAVLPPGIFSCLFLALSYATMLVVLWSLYCMVQSALSVANSPHARMSLHFTLWSTFIIWNLFPVAWTIERIPHLCHLGEPLWLFCNFSAKVVFSSCILYNNFVTIQQRRLAAQIEQEHKDRIVMVAELKEALRHKDEFISVVGHELRTPLNAIIQLSVAMTHNLGAFGTWERHRTWLETIARSATHLLGIINDIITMRAARTGLSLKQELVFVEKVVDHVIHTLSPMAKRGVVLEKALAMASLPPIVGDERRIMQLLSNLIGNALKFTDKGKVAVVVQTDRHARNVIIVITDTGCGIPHQELRKLLVPFKQADMSTNRKFGGTGLGLSIAQQLVDAHAGKLELESKEGEGTTVVVTLPVLQPETRTSLEDQFKERYTASGYSFEDLMDPAVARAEGRRSAVFRASLDSPAGRFRAPSTNDSQYQVEHYQWEDDLLRGEELGGEISAAASGEGGPPPMAVALVSSLYTTEVTQSRPPSNLRPAGMPFTQATASNGLPPGTYQSMQQQNFMMSGLSATAASGSVAGGKDSRSHSHVGLAGQRYSDEPMSKESLELERQQRERLLAWALATQHSVPGATSAGAADGRGASGEGSSYGGPPPIQTIPDIVCVCSEEGGYATQQDPVPEEGLGELEMDEYAGSWHKPARFQDAFDANKEYYSYDNRMSYEYRPSLDFGSKKGGSGRRRSWMQPSSEVETLVPEEVHGGLKTTAAAAGEELIVSSPVLTSAGAGTSEGPPPPLQKNSTALSFKKVSGLKSMVRRSVDLLHMGSFNKLSKGATAGSSTSTSASPTNKGM